jgi:hypothetical protein
VGGGLKVNKSKKENEEFKVVDRRKTRRKKAEQPSEPAAEEPATEEPVAAASEEAPSVAKPEPEPEAKAEEAPKAEPGQPSEQVPTLDAYSAVRWCIAFLTAQAWQWMGLVADPASGQVRKDLAQARLSIDSVAGLVNALASPPGLGRIEPAERRELENLVSNLRLNFVNQSQTATPSTEGGSG